jgi:hypothetical protein
MEAITKYEVAFKLEPDRDGTIYNWACVLMRLVAESSDPTEREKLLSDAGCKLARCQAITGHPSNNQACLAAIRKQVAQFIQLAEALPKGRLPNEEHMRNDTNLDSIRQTPEFKAWWKNRFGNES